jgi:hypothetical protein
MKNFVPLLSAIVLTLNTSAQVLPEQRAVDWSDAGLTTKTSELDADTVNIRSYAGSPADTIYQADTVLDQLIADRENKFTVILLPEGTYYFTSSISLPDSTVLKGAGSDKTTLVFKEQVRSDLISLKGRGGQLTDTLSGHYSGQQALSVPDGEAYTPGLTLALIQDNGQLATSAWAQGTLGHFVTVSGKQDNRLQLSKPLRMPFDSSRHPRLRRIQWKQHAGVECLKLIRQGATSQQTSNIAFRYARNCWVQGVESYQCNFSHVEVSKSQHVAVTGSYFHHAFGYGGGGQAYGVTLHLTTGQCKVANNIFERLRHGMLLQASANANILAYNYSTDPYKANFPNSFTGDLVLHGNYPYANLFEGNTIQTIAIDASHGINGPHNTFFRNRALLYGLYMSRNPASDSQNFIGLEVPDEQGQFLQAGDGHFIVGNNHQGTLLPENGDKPQVNSYYLKEQHWPGNWSADLTWPAYYPATALDEKDLPAKQRYEDQHFTQCSRLVPDTVTHPSDTRQTGFQTSGGTASFYFSPNPASDQVQLAPGKLPELEAPVLKLYNSSGQLSYSKQLSQPTFSVSHLPAGVYQVVLQGVAKQFHSSLVVH